MKGVTMADVRGEFESHFQGSMQARGIVQLAESFLAIYSTGDADD